MRIFSSVPEVLLVFGLGPREERSSVMDCRPILGAVKRRRHPVFVRSPILSSFQILDYWEGERRNYQNESAQVVLRSRYMCCSTPPISHPHIQQRKKQLCIQRSSQLEYRSYLLAGFLLTAVLLQERGIRNVGVNTSIVLRVLDTRSLRVLGRARLGCRAVNPMCGEPTVVKLVQR